MTGFYVDKVKIEGTIFLIKYDKYLSPIILQTSLNGRSVIVS